MAKVEFHFNAPALVPYACRLLRKVQGRGLRAQVVGHPATLNQLDQALWTFSPLDFMSHAQPQSHPVALRHAGILLIQAPLADWHRQVLINLGESIPPGFEAFERVIDVVTIDDLHRAQGRERWRAYARMGHELIRYDLQVPAQGRKPLAES